MEIVDNFGNPVYTEQRPVRYAGFWIRFAASFLNGLVIFIPMSIIYWTLFGTAQGWRVNIINAVVSWLYSALQESSPVMATMGKRAMGLKVTDLRGGRISFAQATGRHFGKYVSFIILLIGYFMMLWDDKNQTLHDKMAGTLVISE